MGITWEYMGYGYVMEYEGYGIFIFMDE